MAPGTASAIGFDSSAHSFQIRFFAIMTGAGSPQVKVAAYSKKRLVAVRKSPSGHTLNYDHCRVVIGRVSFWEHIGVRGEGSKVRKGDVMDHLGVGGAAQR